MDNLTMIENKLVPVYITDTGEKVVFGTELHEVLNVQTTYRAWINRRLEECDAVEASDQNRSFVEEDFITAEIPALGGKGGMPSKQHIIKLDTAKEMAMLERNEKGKQVRRYFIEIEKRYQQQALDTSTLSPQTQALIRLELKQNQIESKVKTVDADLQKFKQDMPILGIEESRITGAVKKKGVECLGGKDAAAYQDKSVRSKVYADIYRQLKREFGVDSYKAIKRNQCDRAVGVIEDYEMPYVLVEKVGSLNEQVVIG